MKKNIELPDIELVSEKVHDAWEVNKRAQGFHAPLECQSDNRKGYLNAPRHGQERFADAGLNEKTYKWCDKCHACLYPYSELSEADKDLDRGTVKAVYAAIQSL